MDWHIGSTYFGFLLCYLNLERPVHRIIYQIRLKSFETFHKNSFCSIKKTRTKIKRREYRTMILLFVDRNTIIYFR